MKKLSKSFVTGAVALVFAVLGYQTALLVHYSAVAAIVAHREPSDTVYVDECHEAETGSHFSRLCPPADRSSGRGPTPAMGGSEAEGRRSGKVVTCDAQVSASIKNQYRRTESFRFNPNTASIEDLQRLGFSEKQAQSIDNYRQKGGRFRRKEDFAASYVVADSVYERLEKYIDIPRLDINKADSAEFDSLPGIGGYFAKKMVEYRTQLHGYSYPEQLMDIYHFDKEKYAKLADLIEVGKCVPYPLWTLPADSLRMHPYIKSVAVARAIVLYRSHNPDSLLSVQRLMDAGIINRENAEKLSKCFIAEP